MSINWRFVSSKWWQVTLMGLLIAVGIALFPQAQCAVAQTCNAPRDLWCNNGQPGKCCDPAHGYSAVTACVRSKPISQPAVCYEIGPGFTESEVPVRCTNSNNCAVTEVLGAPNRLSGGYWYVGKCPKYLVNAFESCGSPDTTQNRVRATCCSGSSGGGGCTPEYAPPTIEDTYTVDPPNPIVWTQEQPPYGMALGMTISDIKAHGGADTACGTGQAKITNITINLELTQESIDWILGELSQRYIGVEIKDTYPKYPERPDPDHAYYSCSFSPLTGANTPNAELDCQFFRPLDPGEYAIHVTACQSDGKCTTKTLPQPVKVWLMEVIRSGSWR
ncbi:hypothetical protein [Anaerolinea sp.]|uniref:hypothetical protein n=1 Tax=Anaerolinea sp. TaxID=1872519 RepID=UPI002ACE20CC|nr:hypothetical protein [Anaerolinea sp.]